MPGRSALQGIINNRWKLGRHIGSGACGDVYEARELSTNMLVVVKMERIERLQLLQHEYEVYQAVTSRSHEVTGIPRPLYFAFFRDIHDYHIMVMERLGPSLRDKMSEVGGYISTSTTLKIAIQMLYRLEHVHSRHFVHRDVKPANILIGRDRPQVINLVDFGIAKQYRHSQTRQHIPFHEGRNMFGTVTFASVNSHLGRELSRRDDLQSLGYTLLYLRDGSLPWSHLGRNLDSIRQFKQEIPTSRLARHHPLAMAKLLSHASRLQFEEEPDYSRLREYFRRDLRQRREDPDGDLQW